MQRRAFLIGAGSALALTPALAVAQVPTSLREHVATNVHYLSGSRQVMYEDLMSPKRTADAVILALDAVLSRTRIIMVATYSTHHVDGILGPHGVHPYEGPGWTVSFVPYGNEYLDDANKTIDLVKFLITVPHIQKIGLPAKYSTNRELKRLAFDAGRVLFTDEGTGPHIKIQAG